MEDKLSTRALMSNNLTYCATAREFSNIYPVEREFKLRSSRFLADSYLFYSLRFTENRIMLFYFCTKSNVLRSYLITRTLTGVMLNPNVI